MTDTPNDMDQIPQGDVMEDEAPARAKKGLPPAVKLAGISLLAMASIGGAMLYTAKQQAQPSKVTRAAHLDATPGGAVQEDSPLYQESVQALNEKRAQRASELGITSVPTPESILKPREDPLEISGVTIPDDTAEPAPEPVVKRPVVAERRVLPQPAPAPKPVERTRVPVQAAPAQVKTAAPAKQEENPYAARISSQMTSMARTFEAKKMSSGDIRLEDEGSAAAAAAAASSPDTAASSSPAQLLLRPGDVLYAETLTSVSSDMNSPVLAEIVSGDYKGARLTGQFTADKTADRMVVSFTNMTLPDGTPVAVNAFAVDGATAETAVASDVERRFVARYAPIIAASFISGYAQSRAQTATTVIGAGDTATVATSSASAKQSLYAGAANAASAISSDIIANAPKGPKIILRDGYPIGIIFIDPVEQPAQ